MSDEEDDADQHDPAVLALLQAAAREGRIELATAERVEQYETEVDAVLAALEVRARLVTDETRVGHFFGQLTEPELRARLELASNRLGLHVQRMDYLWEVAERLRARDHRA